MAEHSQPTQQATQPFEDPRRVGKTSSEISEDDASDVICLLHPNSQAAFDAIKANLLTAHEHILQNEDLLDTTVADLYFRPEINKPREFALRMSSKVKDIRDGFRFGRNPELCDIVMTANRRDKLISNVHFKIFVNSQGSLMLQDQSTNGTIVDDDHLRTKAPHGLRNNRPATRALKNGSIICLVGEPNKIQIKFIVRIPNRGDHEDRYEKNLKQYLTARGEVANFASMRESPYGNYWNGGTTYNFTGLLGKGAFATVYKVQTKSEGDLFAAKELDKRRFIKNGVLDIKFDSELKIMKNLKHPNIVDYIDCQTHGDYIYIIMEYVPHGELAHELRKHGCLSETEVQQVARQIVHALAYLHRRNITHRDIKPDNILIASKNPLRVKLSDFGLSKCVTDQETFLKTFCGTLLYCAPEVYPDYTNYTLGIPNKRRRLGEPAPHSSPYNQSVDMWSFGAVIFHLLCGRAPILGRGDDRGAQMLSNIMTKDVDFKPLRDRGVTNQAIDFVSKLLNRNPFLRAKEMDCLNHPWLRDVPDHCDYGDDFKEADMTGWDLDAVEEEDEDIVDEELLKNLNQLTQPPLSSPGEAQSTASPNRPAKRPRTMIQSETEEVTYHLLPMEDPSLSFAPAADLGPRLFGEITPSLVRSSGVFGGDLPGNTNADVPAIQTRVEQISVNDFGDLNSEAEMHQTAAIPGPPGRYQQTLGIPADPSGSAPSLLGAEAQIKLLNMASPDSERSRAVTPDTINPTTPRTREMSPSSVTKSIDQDLTPSKIRSIPRFGRQIDLNLLGDENAFAADIEARNASRAKKQRTKAETFHVQNRPMTRGPSIELARTLDARNGLEVAYPKTFDRTISINHSSSSPVIENTAPGFVKPPRRFGKLTSLPGSFTNVVVNLDDHFTLWGRGVDCTVPYPDRKETRIPKYAIKVTFWAPGAEAHIENGGDWTQLPGIRTLIATSATGCIYINDVELTKESSDGEAALFGKIYSGDIITIYPSSNEGQFLKLKAEITFGDSARSRPINEDGFIVEWERNHHRRRKERESMHFSKNEDGITTTAMTTVLSVT